MEKCKFCQAELEEGSSLCPACGKDNGEAAEQTGSLEQTPEAVEENVPAAEDSAEEAAEEQASEEAAEGQTAEEAAQEEKPEAQMVPGVKVTPGKIALAVAAIVVLIALLAALIFTGINGKQEPDAEPADTSASAVLTEPAETVPATIPADGDPDNVTCKGSYTVSDADSLAAKDVVVATVDGKELTNGVLQVYYWRAVQEFLGNYGTYAAYFGLDYTRPLDTQLSMESNMTWQQYFLMVGLNNWHQIQAMGLEAEKAGIGISEEDQKYLDEMKGNLEANAAAYNITLEELLRSNIGPGAGYDEFMQYQLDYCTGVPYYLAEAEKLVPSEEELEAYFASHEAEYIDQNITKDALLVDVRHILVMPEGGTTDENGNVVYSDAEWQACEDAANKLLEQWKEDPTEENFAAMANANSADGGSNTKGGLYEAVYEGQMVQPFEAWCFDETRQTGDTGVVRTTYGCYVMYFVTSYPKWKSYAQQDWTTEKTNEMLAGMMQNHPMEVSYEKIALGLVELA